MTKIGYYHIANKIRRDRRRAAYNNKRRYKALCRRDNETVVQFYNRARKHLYKD